ncbi:hypothetical protein UPYG_G00089150 [Umbra pygmaea]|uniref:Fibronectin type III and SPRY domain containing 2 n=1 Tax=Umbra pygmaea TaxID=75934 RepID=A0ABD0XFE7_UMBPY
MDLHEVFTGTRLDVITEEVLSGDEEDHKERNEKELEELNRELPTEETFVVAPEMRETREVSSTFQRVSVDTDDSLRFEAYIPSDEDGTVSHGSADVQDDVFEGHSESERMAALTEEKKRKLEVLYTQLLGCGRWLEASKDLIESAQQLYRIEDKRIEEFAKEKPDTKLVTSLEFETPLADLSEVKTMMDSINIVPAPSAPVINPQVANSATETSLRVCWSLFSNDTVEFYELYYCPVLEVAPATDSTKAPHVCKLKVQETHCHVENLHPDVQYELWVTATNTTGISPASEKALHVTVPTPPIIRERECSSCPEAALIRWESGNTNPVDSYIVELSEIAASIDDGVRESIVGVPTCESLIQLESGKLYSIYVRAVNVGGPSDRSEALTVFTTGSVFHLLQETAHPCLALSEDGFSMFYSDEELPISAMTFDDNTFARCVAVLGDLIPVRGQQYWEVEVEETTEYRIGVAYADTQRNSYLGGTNSSWCMRHILTLSRHKYEFLHSSWSPDIRITVNPVRIGLSLDYEETLSFFNTDLLRIRT